MQRICALLLLFLVSGTSTWAVEVKNEQHRVCLGETCFPRCSDISKLPISGAAHFRYWGFRVYSAALYYSPENGASAVDPLAAGNLELKLSYYRSFEIEDFIKSGESLMQENPQVNFERIRTQSEQMNSLYRAVKPGDSYSIYFRSGRGIELRLNGDLLGTVPGDEFGRAYLGVWLSSTSISEKFTRTILSPERVRIQNGGRELTAADCS
jgi:hypothetical protein